MNNKKFIIATDSTCDLPSEIMSANNIVNVGLVYRIKDRDYREGEKGLSFDEFYTLMREKHMSSTSQVTPGEFEHIFTPVLEKGLDILYIGFSSGLSGTFSSSQIATETLLEKYPDRKIITVDSLCASLGQGLLVYKAIEMYNDGKSMEEIAKWVEDNRLNMCHLFTVDDLMFLHRGGRVSRTSAIAGSILGIKPVLHVDNDGHLIPVSKIRGRKQSIHWMLDEMEKRVGNWENSTFAISHGDCLEDAMYLKNLVTEKFNIKNCIIRHTGTVIGAHSGPGTLALFFLGDYR